jgi:protein SCO1/2
MQPLSCVAPGGRPFTPAGLRGRPTLVVFGFTHCPDVCPTALSYVANALQALGGQADAVRAVFLTVDPERDTPKVMFEYTNLFDPRILGVTGAPDQVAAALKSLGVYSRKAPQDDGNYTMDHTATMLLLDAQGRPRSTLDIHETSEVAAEKIRRLLGAPLKAKGT